MAGPLAGLKIVEMVGLGPGPFCAMMLADMGAEVIRIDQKRKAGGKSMPMLNTSFDILARGRRSLALDLKQPRGVATALKLIAQADALIEGYRPGVMERLGLGPDICLQKNPRLVYGRMTGWGQTGPLAKAAGHDINYIALTGALYAMGRPDEPPPPPLNLVGDFGGGAMMLAFGMVCALLEAKNSGKGQVIDAAMTDGAALLTAMFFGFKAFGDWSNRRGANLLDGGAHFYDTYACSDGKFISIGSIEPQFYALLLKLCAIDDPDFGAQTDSKHWPALKDKLAALFKTKTRAQWCELMEGTDVCFAPVLDLDEAPLHPHNQARQTFIEIKGVTQPAPAPRFSRTPGEVSRPPAEAGEHSAAVLADWGMTSDEIEALSSEEII
ncbi:MAG: CaiB/BaiF CoA-transferase family protein [Sterolibacterium sp.]|nr:CaiB/BaiF CoA-transferase family protein [Sterolibacterium sp.]